MSRWYWLLVIMLFAGCARSPQAIWTELPSADTLLQQLSLTTGQVTSLDGAASVSLTVKGKYLSSQQFLLLEKPDHLRTDVLTGFGQLVLQLTSNGQELAVFMNTTVPGRFYRGPATPANLARFTRIPLATTDMVRILLYDPPIIAFEQRAVLVEKGALLLRLTNATQHQDLIFNEQLQLIGSRYFSAGQVFLEVLYQRLAVADQFPHTIRIDLAAEETTAKIKFSEVQTNVAILPERFRLKVPAKIPVEVLP